MYGRIREKAMRAWGNQAVVRVETTPESYGRPFEGVVDTWDMEKLLLKYPTVNAGRADHNRRELHWIIITDIVFLDEVQTEKPEGDMEREGWAALNDIGCPFTINLHAHYFRKKKSLCEKYAIVDDANLVESYSDVNYCPVCDLRAKQRTHEIDSHAQDVVKERWEVSECGQNIVDVRDDGDGFTLHCALVKKKNATPEQMRVMVHAPEMLDMLGRVNGYVEIGRDSANPDGMVCFPNAFVQEIKSLIKQARGGDTNG